MKYIKTLGLLAIAVMALTAVIGTASASAAAKFTAGKVGVFLEDTTLSEHVLTITGSPVKCSTTDFSGSTEALESTTLRLSPSFFGCTAFGFSATVTNSGCTYILWANGLFDLSTVCKLTISVNNVFAKCTAVITGQFSVGSVSYTNGAGDIVIKFNANSVKDEVTQSSGLCPLTVGTHTNASYTGESTVKASGTTLSRDA